MNLLTFTLTWMHVMTAAMQLAVAGPPSTTVRGTLHFDDQRELVHPAQVHAFDMSDDGHLIASGCGDPAGKSWKDEHCELRIWDGQSGRLIHDNREHVHTQTCVAFSPNGKLLASATDSIEWPDEADARKGELGSIMVAVRSTVSGRRIWEMRATHKRLGSKWIIEAADVQHTPFQRVADDAPPLLPSSKCKTEAGFDAQLLWSSDSQYLAAFENSLLVSVLHVESGRQFSIFGGQKLGPLCVQFGRLSQRLYTLDTEGDIRSWNLKTGQEDVSQRRSLRQAGILDRPEPGYAHSFPRASLCAVRVDSGVALLNLESELNGVPVQYIPNLELTSDEREWWVKLRLSDDHRKLAVCSGMHVRVVDVETGDSRVVLRREKAFRIPIRAWFLPNSHELAFAGEIGLKKIAAAP